MKRFFLYSILALVLIGALAVGGAGAWLFSTLPDVDGVVEVPVLENPVEIMRDEAGVPHIFAKSSRDAYFALGYAHAQDRFWQMEVMRRFGAGRLSEIFGELGLASDKWMRTLNLYGLAEQKAQQLPPATRQALSIYAAGVNARIQKSQSLPWGVPAPEFALFQFKPEPWKPADSLVWGKIMAMWLGQNWRDELLRARLARKLSPKQVGELWPVYPDGMPRTIEKTLNKSAHLIEGLDLKKIAGLFPLPTGLPRGASNAWAVANKHTLTRGAIMANDPHLGFVAPVLWYMARIEAPDLTVSGATVPGLPFTVLGHNGQIAWGMTSTQSDLTDLFVEQLDETGKKYKTPGGWEDFETRTETIAIKGGRSETITVRESRHGPVISDILDKAAQSAGKNAVIALSATYLENDDRSADTFFHINRAKNWDQFVAALKDFQGPQSNFVFADKTGDIGFMAPGLVPIRKGGWGLVPSPGWDGMTDWKGYVPFDELPKVHNPENGWIINSNNPVVDESYPYHLSFDWSPGYRAKRIADRIGEKGQSVHGTARIQQDFVSGMALHMLPLMRDIEPVDEASRRALTMLEKWKGQMSRQRAEPLIFSAWILELNRAIYADELGDLFEDYLTLRPQFLHSVLTRHQKWCDNVNTPEPEDCHDRIRHALKQALDGLKKKFGEDMAAWHWGDVHRARFPHKVLSNVPFLRRFVDMEIPSDGGNYTVNRGASHVNNAKGPFDNIHGPGFRAIYDLEDLRRSRFMIATGQSGNPVSGHYRDLLPDWRDGLYRRLGQARVALKNSALHTLVLTPSSQAK
ncbi:MAG: penicillin acylase family protein [Rhodospirillales bacterium]|nr:penicillin acylase family protein [Alphaproteobacteria bacterium]MBL6947756.1 penicillin acylase family protein [Rhodospirillales bacterium]